MALAGVLGVELSRLLGQFDDAAARASVVKPTPDQKVLLDVLEVERKLIRGRDSAPHEHKSSP